MKQLELAVHELAPRMQHWRRDFHHFAESGWLEFRTATHVAEVLHQLGYQLALGRDVVDDEARMGLPSAEVLAREEQRARAQGALPQWLEHFSGGFTGIVATLETGRPGPTIAFRVDMDALDLGEMQQPSHRPFAEGFASCNDGMMHAAATMGIRLLDLVSPLFCNSFPTS